MAVRNADALRRGMSRWPDAVRVVLCLFLGMMHSYPILPETKPTETIRYTKGQNNLDDKDQTARIVIADVS